MLLIAQLIETFILFRTVEQTTTLKILQRIVYQKKLTIFLHDFSEKTFLIRPSRKYKDFISFLFEKPLLLTKMQVHNCVIFFILVTTLTQLRPEHIQLKGNLLFTELGGKGLNQEYVIYVRLLNKIDLRLLVTYLQQSINRYHSFCDQIKATLELTKNKMEQFHRDPKHLYRYIRSNSKHQLRDAPKICCSHNARLSEV